MRTPSQIGLEWLQACRDWQIDGDPVCSLFWTLPSRKLYPDYYQHISHPLCLNDIQKQCHASSYDSLDSLSQDFLLICANAMHYNEEGSDIYEKAKELEERVREWMKREREASDEMLKVFEGLEKGQDKAVMAVCQRQETSQLNACYTEQEWNVLHAASFYGRLKCVTFLVDRGVDMERGDLLHGSTPLMWAAYGNSLQVAQFLVRKGASVEARNSKGLQAWHLVTDWTDDWQFLKPEEEDSSLMEWKQNGVTFHVGDYVYLQEEEEQFVSIGVITAFKPPNLETILFLRPEQTFHPPTRKFYPQEVFRLTFTQQRSLSSLSGRCCVLHVKDYVQFSVASLSEEDVFVCEYRYLEQQKNISVIKQWKESYEYYELKARKEPLTLVRSIPSVFVKEAMKTPKQQQSQSQPNTSTFPSQSANKWTPIKRKANFATSLSTSQAPRSVHAAFMQQKLLYQQHPSNSLTTTQSNVSVTTTTPSFQHGLQIDSIEIKIFSTFLYAERLRHTLSLDCQVSPYTRFLSLPFDCSTLEVTLSGKSEYEKRLYLQCKRLLSVREWTSLDSSSSSTETFRVVLDPGPNVLECWSKKEGALFQSATFQWNFILIIQRG